MDVSANCLDSIYSTLQGAVSSRYDLPHPAHTLCLNTLLDHTCNMSRQFCVAVLLLALVAGTAHASSRSLSQNAGDAASLQLQFDNTARAIEGGNKNDLLAALANSVFLVPRGKVTLLGVTDQSTLGGLLGSQSVATFRAVGPTTNGKTVLQNCKDNTREGFFRNSPAYNALKDATRGIFRQTVEIEKATCQPA